MLSETTKLERANEKLKKIGIHLEFACYDLKTYTPFLRHIVDTGVGIKYKGYIFRYGYTVNDGVIQLFIREIRDPYFENYIRFENFSHFENYINILKEIKSILEYCNSLGLHIPVYKG